MIDDESSTTRDALHAVAEYLLAAPQYDTSGTIRLTVRPGGFGTVAEPDVRVDGAEVVCGERRARIAGASAAELAEALGVRARALDELYRGGSGVALDAPLHADPAHAAAVAAAFAAGDAALRRFAPDQTPVLWPEHFDIGIALGDGDTGVNYGVSPGDAEIPEPYAYVGPWHPRTGAFWNASFGAARTLGSAPDVEEIVAFFEQGRAELGG